MPKTEAAGPMGRWMYALSLKQPWATLVVYGLKSVEIRRWATLRRGPLLIHASKQWDDRATGWEALPPAAQATLQLRGGIIGQVDLLEIKAYRTQAVFTADQSLHWNRPEWFEPPVLYGFRLAAPRVLPFQPCKGQVRLFRVAAPAPP